MADEVCTVSEGAEEANVEMVATFFRLERSIWAYTSVPGVLGPGKMLGYCGWIWPLSCHLGER